MAKLEKIEFIQIPNIRVIGVEVAHAMAEGAENPVPAVWERCFRDGTVDMLKRLPRALKDCTIGWMGDATEREFKYIIGVAAIENTPVPEGLQYRDLPACDMAKGCIYGNLQNGDVYMGAHNLTVEGIEANHFDVDYSVKWSAEVYPDDMSHDNAGLNAEYGAIYYLCPYKHAE